jgi:hypothetical protein
MKKLKFLLNKKTTTIPRKTLGNSINSEEEHQKALRPKIIDLLSLIKMNKLVLSLEKNTVLQKKKLFLLEFTSFRFFNFPNVLDKCLCMQ